MERALQRYGFRRRNAFVKVGGWARGQWLHDRISQEKLRNARPRRVFTALPRPEQSAQTTSQPRALQRGGGCWRSCRSANVAVQGGTSVAGRAASGTVAHTTA